jgi:hypothetical protein
LREHFLIHEFGRIYGGRGFETGKNVFRIGGNTFYDQKNKIPMKIPEFKRSVIGFIAEFRGILNGFPYLVFQPDPAAQGTEGRLGIAPGHATPGDVQTDNSKGVGLGTQVTVHT